MAYTQIVCKVRPQKAKVSRTCVIYGGSNLELPINYGTPTAGFMTVKVLLNSVLPTKGGKFMCIDTKDFYFNTLLAPHEYLQIKLENFPEDVVEHYQMRNKIDTKKFVYMKCHWGMHGLPHVGIIAQ